MIPLPHGARIWLACGVTDMRRGFDGLATLVQTQLAADPYLCDERLYVAADGKLAAKQLISWTSNLQSATHNFIGSQADSERHPWAGIAGSHCLECRPSLGVCPSNRFAKLRKGNLSRINGHV